LPSPGEARCSPRRITTLGVLGREPWIRAPRGPFRVSSRRRFAMSPFMMSTKRPLAPPQSSMALIHGLSV
jgi:hypothetical protein